MKPWTKTTKSEAAPEERRVGLAQHPCETFVWKCLENIYCQGSWATTGSTDSCLQGANAKKALLLAAQFFPGFIQMQQHPCRMTQFITDGLIPSLASRRQRHDSVSPVKFCVTFRVFVLLFVCPPSLSIPTTTTTTTWVWTLMLSQYPKQFNSVSVASSKKLLVGM